jgi:hypothetical protein
MGRQGEGRGSIDYIPSQGNKNLLTIAAEARPSPAMTFSRCRPGGRMRSRTARAVNDVVEPLIKQNGDVNGTVKYLGKAGDKWLGVPPASAARSRALLAHRPDEEARRHRRAGDVSGRRAPKADSWTTDTFLKAPRPATRAAFPSASVSARPATTSTRRRVLPGVRRRARRQQGQSHVKTDAVRQAWNTTRS